jgi:hypothetical protein
MVLKDMIASGTVACNQQTIEEGVGVEQPV